MNWDLRGKTAVVTGGASGIGRATCVALARAGCDLVVVDLKEEGMAETKLRVENEGRLAITYQVDVSSFAEVQKLADEVAKVGGADVLVNNAGVTVLSDFSDHSLEDFEWLMGVNFWGVVYGCKAFLPQLESKEHAHIVNVSSIFGVVGMPSQSSYCASKFAVRGLSESLRIELADKDIGVTSVHPGGVRTGIAQDARTSGEHYERQKLRSIRFFEEKAMAPERIADAIVRSVRKNQGRLVITPEAHLLDLAQRTWPSGLGTLIRWGRKRLRA